MKKQLSALALILTLSGCGFEIVDTGHRGVETNLGKVVSDSLPEGIYFYNPFTSHVVELDVRTQTQTVDTSVYTKDVQQAEVSGVINYNLDKTKVHIVYQEVGSNWDEVLVPQVLQGSIKNVIGKWDAVDLVANRDKATVAIKESIQAGLENRGVTVTHFEISNIDFADKFEEAVEAKVVAIQRASESENKTKQIQEEAKQKVIGAKAEAESMRIRANALSQNKGLVEYEAVQKWNGVLPQYSLGGATPFISIK